MASQQDYFDRIAGLLPEVHAIRASGKRFSDIVDRQGHQYIDLVMEGGGTLGIALLGYIHVLEQAGLRFIGIGGTSAGAVSAIALGAAGRPEEERLARLIEPLAGMPMRDFIDGRKPGDRDALEAVEAWLEGASLLRKLWWSGRALDNLRKIDGLNRGDAFLGWMSGLLKGFNDGRTMTVADLRARMTAVPELWLREDIPAEQLDPALFEAGEGGRRLRYENRRDPLVVVTADIATETRLELPAMADLLWPEPDQLDAALLARASMSIPLFFAPVRVASRPADQVRHLWRRFNWPEHDYEGDFLPREHCLVDGGVLSNFPIRAFHARGRLPLRPTFGVKLQYDEHRLAIRGPVDILRYAFNSARHALDLDFIAENPDYSRVVAYIDTGDIQWLDFAMPDATRLDLFERGARTALDFLKGFDWAGYKDVRRRLLAV